MTASDWTEWQYLDSEREVYQSDHIQQGNAMAYVTPGDDTIIHVRKIQPGFAVPQNIGECAWTAKDIT